jgi:hypothetical protein
VGWLVSSFSTLSWHPEILNAKLHAAAQVAFREVEAAAEAKNPAKTKIKVSLHSAGDVASVSASGLGKVFEFGRRGGYPIEPKGLALKFRGGGFARGTVPGGAMGAEPFLRPAAALFPAFYRRAASGLL